MSPMFWTAFVLTYPIISNWWLKLAVSVNLPKIADSIGLVEKKLKFVRSIIMVKTSWAFGGNTSANNGSRTIS